MNIILISFVELSKTPPMFTMNTTEPMIRRSSILTFHERRSEKSLQQTADGTRKKRRITTNMFAMKHYLYLPASI